MLPVDQILGADRDDHRALRHLFRGAAAGIKAHIAGTLRILNHHQVPAVHDAVACRGLLGAEKGRIRRDDGVPGVFLEVEKIPAGGEGNPLGAALVFGGPLGVVEV